MLLWIMTTLIFENDFTNRVFLKKYWVLFFFSHNTDNAN